MAKQAMKTSANVANKWATNLSASTQTMTAGVQSVQTSPTSLAAANPDGYLAGVQKAVTSGKWQARLQSVTLQQWQQAMVQKGIPRVQTGAQTGKPKVQSFMDQLLPYVYQLRAALASQPRGSLAQNMQRMNTFVQGMAQFKRQ